MSNVITWRNLEQNTGINPVAALQYGSQQINKGLSDFGGLIKDSWERDSAASAKAEAEKLDAFKTALANVQRNGDAASAGIADSNAYLDLARSMGVKEKDAIPYLDTLLTKARQSQGVDQAYNEAKQLEAVKPLMQAFDAAITEGNLEGAAAIKENYPELAPYSAKLQEALYKGSEAVKAKQRTENEYADKRTLAALSIDNAQITNKANRRTNAKAESDDRVSSFLSSIISQNAAQEGSISPDFIEKTGKAAGLTSEERVKAVLLAQDANAKKTATLAGLQKAKIQSTYGDSLLGEGLYSDPAGREAVEKQIAALKLNPDEASNIRGTIGKLNKEYGQLPVRALLQALQASETGWIRDQEVADSFKTQFENLVGNARDIAPLLKQYNDDVKRLKSLTP